MFMAFRLKNPGWQHKVPLWLDFFSTLMPCIGALIMSMVGILFFFCSADEATFMLVIELALIAGKAMSFVIIQMLKRTMQCQNAPS